MLLSPPRSGRRGTTLVEAALVYPIVFFLIVCVVVIGVGVFRHQQMAWLAREGARWASVRGPQYASETGSAAATQDAIRAYVTGKAAGLDTASLTITPTWTTYVNGTPTTGHTTSGATTDKTEVVVQVSYTWVPEAFATYLPGATLTSTTKLAMSY